MFKWIKANWGKSILLLCAGYLAHIAIEAFIVTNILAIFGYSIPTFV